MLFEYNPTNGEIYKYGRPLDCPDEQYATIELSIEGLPDFPQKYIGEENYWNEEFQCYENHKEVYSYYVIKEGALYNRTMEDRFNDTEFTLEDFRNKVKKALLRNYLTKCKYNDMEIAKHDKRERAGILTLKDEKDYKQAIQDYKEFTNWYKERKKIVEYADSFNDIFSVWKEVYGII